MRKNPVVFSFANQPINLRIKGGSYSMETKAKSLPTSHQISPGKVPISDDVTHLLVIPHVPQN